MQSLKIMRCGKESRTRREEKILVQLP
jgi:hypothetical protein